MVVECETCKKVFKFQCHLTRHLNRKTPCGIAKQCISEEKMALKPISKEIHVCCNCNKEFSSANSLLKHKNGHCPAVKKIISDPIAIVNDAVNSDAVNDEIVSRPEQNPPSSKPNSIMIYPGIILSRESLIKTLNELSADEMQLFVTGDKYAVYKFYLNLLKNGMI